MVNVVSKGGTNARHGDAYFYFKNQCFNAANAAGTITLFRAINSRSVFVPGDR
jgi:hypothetical protein